MKLTHRGYRVGLTACAIVWLVAVIYGVGQPQFDGDAIVSFIAAVAAMAGAARLFHLHQAR